jgi:hypothetical protein
MIVAAVFCIPEFIDKKRHYARSKPKLFYVMPFSDFLPVIIRL